MDLTEADVEVLVERYGHDPNCLASLRVLAYQQTAPGAQGPSCQMFVIEQWANDLCRFFGCKPRES